MRATVAERLERYTHRCPMSGCWLWTGCVDGSGYAAIQIEYRTRIASRVAWELCNGPIDAGMCVCHRCDVPACVNPAHLFLGSKADNMADRTAKGRQPRGSATTAAKLDETAVERIRVAAKAGRRHAQLARDYGVTQRTIRLAVDGDTWKHIHGPSVRGGD